MVNDDTLPILFIIPRLCKFVFQDKELSRITKGQALYPIWEYYVIYRTLSLWILFYIGKQIGDTIPVAVTKTIKVEFSEFKKLAYDKKAKPILEKLYICDRKKTGGGNDATGGDSGRDSTQSCCLLICSDKLRLLIILQMWIPLVMI
jgi:hypothetical protein